MIEELKEKTLVKSAKVKRYKQRIEQFRQNRIFDLDQKKIYVELNRNEIRSNDVPNAEECTKFWGDIWSVRKEHNREAEWLKDLKRERVNVERPQERVSISVEKIRKQCRKIPNWKAPGRDGVQGYWIKNLSSLHERVSSQMNRILMGEDDLPEWMTHGRTVLCQKDPQKGNTADNYRPITCLPLMWKLLTGVIAEEMYNYLEREKILPEEQKGCKKGSRGIKDKLLIDKTVLKDCKKDIPIYPWYGYITLYIYDLVPHSWVSKCMEMFGTAENMRTFLEKSMQQSRLSLMANSEDLGEFNVKMGIFQGVSLLPLLFVLSMVPLSLIIKNVNSCYKWGKREYKLNHLLFTDDLKLYTKSEEQTNPLMRTVHVFSNDIGMEFGIKKYGILTMESGKIVKSEGVKLPDGE